MPDYVPKLFKDLPVQIPLRDFRGMFRVLIPKINIAFHKIIYTNKCQDTFSIVQEQERVDISSGDFKSIYNFILINKVSAIKLWEQKWRVDLNNNGLNWNKIGITYILLFLTIRFRVVFGR